MTATDADRVARLAAELAELGRRLAWARYELLTLPIASEGQPARPGQPEAWSPADLPRPGPLTGTAARSGSTAPPPHAVPESRPAPASHTEPPAAHAEPPAAESIAEPAAPPAEPAEPAAPPAAPAARTAGIANGRLLAWAGGSITLVGVVMFLALAASRGWFGVPARLVAGAVLGVALVGLGARLHRRAGGQTGALALVGTGIAALYLDVGAATARYDYLPEPAGLLLALVVAGAGVAVADRWRSELLAGGAVTGAGLLLPVLAGSNLPLTVAMVLVMQLAVAPAVLRRRWSVLAGLVAVFPVMYGCIAVLEYTLSVGRDRQPILLATLAVFGVGAVLAVLGSTRSAAAAAAVRFAAPVVPVLGMATAHGGRVGALIAGGVGLAALAVLLPAGRLPEVARPHRLVRTSAGAVAAVAFFEATGLAVGGSALAGVLLGQALVLTVLATATGRRGLLLAGGAYGVVGLALSVFRDAPLAALVRFPSAPYLVLGTPDDRALLTGLTLSALVLLVAVAVLVAATRMWPAGGGSSDATDTIVGVLRVLAGATGLYGAAGTVITAALLAVPSQAGFVGGHALVTISWTLLALVLLARGIARTAPRLAGLVLMAASVSKLVLFDLVALDGMARVAAFVGAGLLMLAAGSHYARLVARSQA